MEGAYLIVLFAKFADGYCASVHQAAESMESTFPSLAEISERNEKVEVLYLLEKGVSFNSKMTMAHGQPRRQRPQDCQKMAINRVPLIERVKHNERTDVQPALLAKNRSAVPN
jgi:hypothetical protein